MNTVLEFKGISVPKFSITTTDTTHGTKEKISGVTPKVMATINGETVMIKGDDCYREPFIELLAYRLGTVLGLKVNRVKLLDCGDLLGLNKLVSAHYWEDSFITAAQLGDDYEDVYNDILRKFFDTVLNNDDRHSRNWGYLNNEMFLIDNGMSYMWLEFEESYYEYYIINAITCEKTLPFVQNFCLLNEEDIIELVKYPTELEYNPFDEIFFDRILTRIFTIQDYVKEKIIQNGGSAIWLM